jgi:hypothetical protein
MPTTDKPFSRREFARQAVLGAASAAVLTLRDIVPATGESERPPVKAALQTSAQNPAGAPKLSPQSQAEADFRFQAILSQYPDRFSEAQKTDLRRLCVLAQPPLDRIRAYAISNGDLPALYLKPLVDGDKKPATPASSTAKPSAAANSAPATPRAKSPKKDQP